MATINLDIGSHFDSRGLDAMDRGVKVAAGTVRRASGALGDVVTKLEGLDGTLGKVAKTGGALIGNVMSLGIWGAVAAAVGVVVSKFAELRSMLSENKKAADELADGWAKAREFQERRDEKHAKKIAEEAKKAAEAEAKEHSRIVKMQDDARKRNAQERNAADSRADSLDLMQMEADGASEFQLAYQRATNKIADAERQIEFVKRFGGDLAKAEDDLAAAEIAFDKVLQDRLREEESRQAERALADADAIEAEEREAEAMRERARVEEDVAKRQAEGAAALEDADKRLEDARRRAAELEENAKRARGKSFNEWRRGEKDLAREEERQARRDAGNIERATRDRNAIFSRVFDRDGNLRKSANESDVRRFRELETFLKNQDPANNPAFKDIKVIEAERKKIMEDTKAAIDNIKKRLEFITT